MVPLLPYTIGPCIPKGQLLSGGKDIAFTMLREKGEGHTEKKKKKKKTECGMGDIAVANFGKYSLSHHLFSFGIGNQIEFQLCKFKQCCPVLHSVISFFVIYAGLNIKFWKYRDK